jgi:Concanavalin A-like lectin/glucanases superfamily
MGHVARVVAVSVACVLALPACGGAAVPADQGAAAAQGAAPGPVRAYSFEAGGGATAADGSGHGRDARVRGARHVAGGRFGGALSFDGSNDLVRSGRLNARRATVEAWVRPRSRKGGWRAVVSAGGRSPAFALYVRPGRRGAGALVRGRHARARRALVGWTHLAATYDGRAVRLYVDGRSVARRAVSARRIGGALRIGGAAQGSRAFAGLIDEVRVYRRALSGREIRADMAVLVSAPDGGGPGQSPETGPIPVYTDDRPPRTPPAEELPLVDSVAKDGITWSFSQPERVGHFITGDPYVIGSATISSITPPPTSARNGSMKNLPTTLAKSGFDERLISERFQPSLRAELPIQLAPGDSLVSSISETDEIFNKRIQPVYKRRSSSPVRTVSVLTSVAEPQPPDAFRPSYAGHGPIYLSRNLRRELLPRLTRVPVDWDPVEPQMDDFTELFRRPWIDHLQFNFDAPGEYMPDYAREIVRAVGGAGLLLTLDYTVEEKEALLVYFTQYGIDLHGLLRAGHPGWPAHGGHGSGRKFPIVLAGTLLGAPELQSPSGSFGEDMQTFYGTAAGYGLGWTGHDASYAGHLGPDGPGPRGPYEHLQPSQWLKAEDGTYVGENYRRCCTTMAWVGEALAARLIPGVQHAWNHPAFFDYVDRWMTEDDGPALQQIREQIGDEAADMFEVYRQRKAYDPWVTNMWQAYR